MARDENGHKIPTNISDLRVELADLQGESRANDAGLRGEITGLKASLGALSDRLTERFESQKTAVAAAQLATNARLDLMNEFRNQLRDQAGTFITRSELTLKFESMSKEIENLKDRQSYNRGRDAAISAGIAATIAVISTILVIFR